MDLGLNPVDPHVVLRSDPESDSPIQDFKPPIYKTAAVRQAPGAIFTRVACKSRVVTGPNGGHRASIILAQRFFFIE